MSSIEINGVSLDYISSRKKFRALQDVSLQIKSGEFVSILGPSGCGKSTLLSILSGLNHPTEGWVSIDGHKITGPGTDRSVVFQDYSLFPWMTARKNVAFGVRQVQRNLSKKSLYEIADHYLREVELYDYRNKYVKQLSGGQQQRVSIARALAMDTPILLMDEPFGALDPRTRISLQKLLLKLWRNDEKSKRKTVVFVTHDIDESIFLSDRIVVMKPNPGQIRQIVHVPFARPRNREELITNEKYQKFYQNLVSLFYEQEDSSVEEEAYREEIHDLAGKVVV